MKQLNKITHFHKISSALTYGISSFLITVINKIILTNYEFPSFLVLSIGQMTATIIILYFAQYFHITTFPKLKTINEIRNLFPLPVLHLGNMIFGLGSTQLLNLPMFTSLRRVGILSTMLMESMILNIKPMLSIQISIYGMLFGALIAAANDITFNAKGYIYVMLSNVLTSANGVFLKHQLNSPMTTINISSNATSLLYYNSLVMIIPLIIISWFTNDINQCMQFKLWNTFDFLLAFFISCVMGFILLYSTFLCTEYNSALTTSVIGCLKNVLITYFGIIFSSDYLFSWWNVIGIHISIICSLYYSYVIL